MYSVRKETNLLDLIFIAGVRTWNIIGERFWAGEFVVGRWCCDDIALTCDLACEACNGAGNCRFVVN